MANTLNLGTDGNWATKEDSLLGYNSENGNFKPLPFDFTRASSATVVNKAGLIETVSSGEPRIDFQGNTKGALLLEPSSTNLVTYSNDFSNSSWSKPFTISTNTVISPDGTLNASTFKASSNSGGVILNTNIAKTAFIKYSFSFYVKKSNHRYIGLSVGTASTSGSYNFYDFDTDTINNTIVSPQNAPITRELIGNGWVKLTQVFEMEDSAFLNSLTRIAMTNSSGSTTYTPSGTEEVYVYGAQLEQKSHPTSHILTQGSAVTRVADVSSQTPPSGIIGQTEGTLFIEYPNINDLYAFIGLSINGGNSNRMIIYSSGNNILNAQFRQGAAIKLSGISSLITGKVKGALSFSSTESVFYVNGTQIAVGTAAAWSGLNQVDFNQANQIGAKVSEIKYYNTRLSNAELQALTSN